MTFHTIRLAVILGLVAASDAALAQTVSIGSETVTAGGIATVALDISGLGQGTALGAFDVALGFNPTIISFDSASFGDPKLGDQLNLEGYGTFSAITPGSGQVDLTELSFDSPTALQSSQATSFTLATLSFDTVGTGTSALSLSVNGLGGFSDQNGNALTPTLQGGAITVQGGTTAQAPELGSGSAAAAITLLLGGLMVAGGRRNK
jgi:hypothetical protein